MKRLLLVGAVLSVLAAACSSGGGTKPSPSTPRTAASSPQDSRHQEREATMRAVLSRIDSGLIVSSPAATYSHEEQALQFSQKKCGGRITEEDSLYEVAFIREGHAGANVVVAEVKIAKTDGIDPAQAIGLKNDLTEYC